MPKPYSLDLRERVVRAIEDGLTRAAVAERYEIGISTVGRYLRRKAEKGGLEPEQFGGYRPYALAGHEDLIRGWVAECSDLTLRQLGERLREREIEVGQTAIFNFLEHLNLTLKKNSSRRRAGEGGRQGTASGVD
jgi:transposase